MDRSGSRRRRCHMASSRLLSVFLFGILSSCVFSADIPDEIGVTWVKSEPTGLYFSKYETTVAQYQACLRAGACDAANYFDDEDGCNARSNLRADYPMNCVSWQGAVEFCKWRGARLPTEDEWYAEASNNGSRIYPWGDAPEASCTHCVMEDPAEGRGCGTEGSMLVGSKPLGDSVSGVSDLSGNVSEWTATEYVIPPPPPPEPGSEPAGRASCDGICRVIRGGGYRASNDSSLQPYYQAAYRRSGSIEGGAEYGFRCVADTLP